MYFKFFILIIILYFFIKPVTAFAIVDPLTSPNNKVGIHILDPNEVEKVADLVNANGGDWGYVTVPLRDDDKDRVKWQRFMDNCRRLHLIPIIRLATVMTTQGWEEPNLYRSLDFANFLADLVWPTQNRYVAVYNEPNHATEWGGYLDPASYSRILKFTSQIFKNRSQDFFILPAGFDAAAPNGYGCLNLYTFISQMVSAEPDVFDYIDGWNTHAYPNPGFSGNPYTETPQSISGYRHELAYLKTFTAKDLPVFITETGWSSQRLSEESIAGYYQTAFNNVWNEEKIVAVTPFLFYASAGPFTVFSFLRPNGEAKAAYQAVRNLAKTKGSPLLAQPPALAQVLAGQTINSSINHEETKPILAKEKWQSIFMSLEKYIKL